MLPFVLFGLPAGLWVDRVRRRPVLIATDIGRATLLATVPLAAVAGWLGMPQLYAVSFGMGALTVLFRVAYSSFLPSVVSRSDLADGNAKLALAEAVARVGGPGLAGGLIQLLAAPLAILVDCASFLVSAASLGAIRARENVAPVAGPRGVWAEVPAGFGGVFGQVLLRPLFVGTTLGNTADGLVFQSGLIVLFLTRELRLQPALLGAVFAGLGIGGLIGAVLAGPATRVLGLGATILTCLGLWSVGLRRTGRDTRITASTRLCRAPAGRGWRHQSHRRREHQYHPPASNPAPATRPRNGGDQRWRDNGVHGRVLRRRLDRGHARLADNPGARGLAALGRPGLATAVTHPPPAPAGFGRRALRQLTSCRERSASSGRAGRRSGMCWHTSQLPTCQLSIRELVRRSEV
ncbi:MAG: MFS transporter [Chloroflexota bacterium]|nr:MFS transporter [Chloroflexota bacterium]